MSQWEEEHRTELETQAKAKVARDAVPALMRTLQATRSALALAALWVRDSQPETDAWAGKKKKTLADIEAAQTLADTALAPLLKGEKL